MATQIVIDPVTRLEGHLRVELTVDVTGGARQITAARVSGTSFRGFEQMLVGRNPAEAPHLTQRICGVCPIPHGLAAVMALDQAARLTVPANARLLRDLTLAANFIHSHLLHFYQLSLLDYVSGPAMPPWQPEWDADRRLNAATSERLANHYSAAIKALRQTQEMGAIFAGRMPHSPAIIPGGFTTVPTAAQIRQAREYTATLLDFIRQTYLPDVALLAAQYPDYRQLGRGPANFLAFGVFTEGNGQKPWFPAGRVVNGATEVLPLNPGEISEQVGNSWYEAAAPANPATEASPAPQHPKTAAYSWIKAARYAGAPCETGPLARQWIRGQYRQGISVMDRHLARAQETLAIAEALPTWLDQLAPGKSAYAAHTAATEGSAAGMLEAPRGALGHWVQLAGGKIARYQVVTPTCWNASPRDDAQTPGPLEAALVGTPIGDEAKPVEALRVIHSFDPCLACAVHVVRPASTGRKA